MPENTSSYTTAKKLVLGMRINKAVANVLQGDLLADSEEGLAYIMCINIFLSFYGLQYSYPITVTEIEPRVAPVTTVEIFKASMAQATVVHWAERDLKQILLDAKMDTGILAEQWDNIKASK